MDTINLGSPGSSIRRLHRLCNRPHAFMVFVTSALFFALFPAILAQNSVDSPVISVSEVSPYTDFSISIGQPPLRTSGRSSSAEVYFQILLSGGLTTDGKLDFVPWDHGGRIVPLREVIRRYYGALGQTDPFQAFGEVSALETQVNITFVAKIATSPADASFPQTQKSIILGLPRGLASLSSVNDVNSEELIVAWVSAQSQPFPPGVILCLTITVAVAVGAVIMVVRHTKLQWVSKNGVPMKSYGEKGGGDSSARKSPSLLSKLRGNKQYDNNQPSRKTEFNVADFIQRQAHEQFIDDFSAPSQPLPALKRSQRHETPESHNYNYSLEQKCTTQDSHWEHSHTTKDDKKEQHIALKTVDNLPMTQRNSTNINPIHVPKRRDIRNKPERLKSQALSVLDLYLPSPTSARSPLKSSLPPPPPQNVKLSVLPPTPTDLRPPPGPAPNVQNHRRRKEDLKLIEIPSPIREDAVIGMYIYSPVTNP